MEETEHDTSRRGWLPVFALLLIPVLYLAALGPVHGLVTRGYISNSACMTALNRAYYPLELLDEKTEFFDTHPVGQAYVAYVEWFR